MPESERIRQVLRYAVAGGEDDFRRHDELRSRFQEALRRRSQRAWVVAEPQPRYDEVFAKGQEWLDRLAGEPLQPVEGELIVSDEVWKSPARTDPGLS